MSVAGAPTYTGCRMPPISPMSWNGGNQNTPLSPGRCADTRWITAELCNRLACVSMTPRGSPVEPDVYCSIASSEPDAACRTGDSAFPRSWLTSSQRTCGGASPSASQLSSRAASEE